MTKTLKHFTYYALLLIFLTACQKEAPPISFMVFGDPAEYAAYEELVAAFTAAHPDIPIQLRHIPSQSEYRQRLATDFSAGSPPDIMLLNYRRFAEFAGQNALEPLGPYLADSQLIQADDFYEQTISAFTWDNQLWCIPQNISSLVVYYNQDLFEAAGVPLPTSDWTWDDFVTAARALTVDTDGDGRFDQYGAGVEASLFRLAPFIWQNGGDLVDNPAQPTRLTLDSPESLAALQWLVDLQVKEQIVPDAVAEAAEESESRFLNGRLAMFFNSRRGVPTYRTITTFTWDVAPLPIGQQAAGILHSDAYCLAAAATNKEAAWTFIEFANSPTGQSLIATSGRTVPSLRSVADSPAFLDNQPPAHARVFLDSIPVLGQVPLMPSWVRIEETASQEIERAFYGQVSAAEAAATAVTLTQPFFNSD
ncbi:MAG: sugar ABC transporter substrate-binding protein [Ardenticatenaceae bacterium]|nr:sugar ABC transporter substrate-binding protein [Ardenticatenaceae bacterium]